MKNYEDMTDEERANYQARVAVSYVSAVACQISELLEVRVKEAYLTGVADTLSLDRK